MPQPRVHADHAARQRAYRERQRQARAAELTAKGMPPAPPIPTMPSRQRWDALIEQARAALETARDEMQAYWDERTPAWQEGEKGEAMQARIDALDGLAEQLADLAAE